MHICRYDHNISYTTQTSNGKRQRRQTEQNLIMSTPVKIYSIVLFHKLIVSPVTFYKDTVTQSINYLGYTLHLHLDDDDENARKHNKFNSVARCSFTKWHNPFNGF